MTFDIHARSIKKRVSIPFKCAAHVRGAHNALTLAYLELVVAANQETSFTGDMKASPWPDKRETANFLTLSPGCFSLFEAKSPRKKSVSPDWLLGQTEGADETLS